MESVASKFNVPSRYTFACGSGDFGQGGYLSAKKLTIDVVFTIIRPSHWQSIDVSQFSGDYPLTRVPLVPI